MRFVPGIALVALVATTISLSQIGDARANTCPITGGLSGVTGCIESAARALTYIAEHSDHTFQAHLACATGNATCSDSPSCDGGLVYNVWEDGTLLPWQACLDDHQASQINGLTPGFVERAFKRLTWPASVLVVQPPDGKTLVNFATNFYTTNTDPTTQTVTLLGQRVTVEATPTLYAWHFGQDDAELATSDPGAAYPDLRVTYRYLRSGTVHPSVETTYAGRFRVDGGAWQTIPDTLTVPGERVDLQVLTATPHLVG